MKTEILFNVLGKATNVGLVLALVVATLLLRKDIVKPARLGFRCDDLDIQHPDAGESVSTSLLVVLGFFACSLFTVLGDFFRTRNSSVVEDRKTFLKGSNRLNVIPSWVFDSILNVILVLVGLCSTVFFVEVGKTTSGVLRPNFISLCRPNVTCEGDKVYYHPQEYVCLNGEKADNDSRRSFPSGHASVVAYFATFVVFMAGAALKRCPTCPKMVTPVVRLIALTLAWIVGLSRITDRVHHIADVIVGYLIGAAIGWYTFKMIEDENSKSDTSRKFMLEESPTTLEQNLNSESAKDCVKMSQNNGRDSVNHNKVKQLNGNIDHDQAVTEEVISTTRDL